MPSRGIHLMIAAAAAALYALQLLQSRAKFRVSSSPMRTAS